MKLLNLSVLIGIGVFSATAAPKTSPKISVEVLAIEFPPYTTSKLETDGIAFEKLRAHPAMSEIEVTAKFTPPTRIGKRLLLRDWCMSFYPPRDQKGGQFKKWEISKEEVKLGFYRVKQDGEFTWGSLSELKGHSVGLLSSYSKKGLSGLMYANALDVYAIDSLEQGFDLLVKNRIDLVFSDKYSGQFIAIDHGYDLQELQFSDTALSTERFHVWVNLSCTQLVTQLEPHWAQ
ncbi:hypothetical protein L4D20_05895 [Vibrio kyushuensis]|uniref:hypothetical protein n=1 Tax=Vibrio kyushuensis TaxID=2910249 RepID=UPI003D152862